MLISSLVNDILTNTQSPDKYLKALYEKVSKGKMRPSRMLDIIALSMIVTSEYLEWRGVGASNVKDVGHEKALKKASKLSRKVEKLMGYEDE